ncbi:tRNA-dihydrouridine(20a/20b) synthase [NAD(P)+]-like isoform X2 [Sipha flava]|uniref:tRNA-dihydrouridine(20a/20b) synthase [NAD(P)+] n=1 Tax=Sipha flava TaxID=143950 RepID=A0A8B8FBH7_9HEMI|nr:tRNA-dihydrouridine(20a/20b) synthase [NAD(P)+]-like isoform X2 [Sipha flava]XP_025408209.1 tRNA-dihydrouridine(20a/20b) synthase [NAD(P)+]-like isoform X2 [Sipha flava]
MNSVVELFNDENKKFVKVCAPMVRYSKLQFRKLIRLYDCDLCFTPMIMADSYVRSAQARAHEFQSDTDDRPLIVQFGANNSSDFINASNLIIPYCDGIDLNCGCPQRWALNDGYGAQLLKNPEIIKDCVRQFRNRFPSNKTISVKLRLLVDNRKSVDLCQQIEATGISFITVHGRTAIQKNQPIDQECIKLINESVGVPVILNGDVKNLSDAISMHEYTGCKGIMSARGILHNPGLFAGHKITPISAVINWLNIYHTNFLWFHHHLVFMCDRLLSKNAKNTFNQLRTASDVISFLESQFHIPNVLSSNRKLGKELSGISGTYYQNVVKQKNVSSQSEDFMESSFNLFE